MISVGDFEEEEAGACFVFLANQDSPKKAQKTSRQGLVGDNPEDSNLDRSV